MYCICLGICYFSSRLHLVGIISQRCTEEVIVNSLCDNLVVRCRGFLIQVGESICHIVGKVEHCRPPFVIEANCIDSVDLIAEDANLGHGLRSRETSLGINFPYQQCRPKGRSHSYGVRTTGQLQAPASLGGVVDDIIPNMAILLSKEEPLHGKFAVNLADYSKLWEAYLYPPAESTDSLNGISSAGYGRWIRRTTNGINYYNVCSKCGYETVLDTQSKYCPNCGFPMDLGMPDLAGKEEC